MFFDVFNRCRPRYRTYRVAAKRRKCCTFVCFGNFICRNRDAARNAVCYCLCARNNVGDNVIMLNSPPFFPCPAKPGLYFIAYEQTAVFFCNIVQYFEIFFGRRYKSSHTLYRFGNNSGNFTIRLRKDQFFEIFGATHFTLRILSIQRAPETIRAMRMVNSRDIGTAHFPIMMTGQVHCHCRPAVVSVPQRYYFLVSGV